jgi:hypothetical protein
MRSLMVLAAMLGSTARADEDEQRRRVALNAELCAASEYASSLLTSIRKRAAVLLKDPLAEQLAEEIKIAQDSYSRNEGFVLKVKEAMVAARATTRSCTDKLTKTLVRCIFVDAAGNMDGICDHEPNVASIATSRACPN